MAPDNPLRRLATQGQSIWLDYIERRILEDGTLDKLIEEDGLAGMTSNPAIFEKAIDNTDAYNATIAEMASRHASAESIFEHLAIYDVRAAADLLRPVYERTDGADGFVSLEVSPLLARDTESTIAEARRLWDLLKRPNVMIKVPGTREGLPAIRRLLAEGVNVNVTLLFAVDRYVEVTDAFMGGLEDRLKAGLPIDRIASVASFFLSRIDTMVDAELDDLAEAGNDEAEALRGEAAIASAGMAYRRFQEQYAAERWQPLQANGARCQRLLWASTSTKDPNYSDVKYVEALIGPQTVNTLPMETLRAYREHGDPEPRLHDSMESAPMVLQRLAAVGIDLEQVTGKLEEEGIRKFVEPYRKLLDTIETQRQRISA